MNNKTSITFRIDNEFIELFRKNKSEHLREILHKYFYDKVKCQKCGVFCYESRIINDICIICNDDLDIKNKPKKKIIDNIQVIDNAQGLSDEQIKYYFNKQIEYKASRSDKDLSVKDWAVDNVPIKYNTLMKRAKKLNLY